MSKNKNNPRLRFPEFNDSPEWESKPLKKLTKINQGLQIAISERYLERVPESYFYITNEFLKENSSYKYFIKNPPESVICNKDDILMTRTGNTGQIVTNVNGAFHNNFFKIKYFSDLNKNFLVYFLKLPKTQHEIMSYAGTSTIPDLNHSDFYRICIQLPTNIAEQEKIAECLSSVDELITAQADKIAALKEHKKGLMQKLFPRDSETTPFYRFPEFRNSLLWQDDKLGNVIEHTGGTALEEYVDPNGQYKFISIGNYTTDGKYFDNGQRIVANNKTLSKLLNVNDLVMVLNDKTSKGDIIGATILIDKDNNYIYNQRSERIICKSAVRAKFLWVYFNSTIFRDKVYQISQGGTQIYVNFPNVKKLDITYPIIHDEQEKIAECLSSLDELISLHSEKLSTLKEHKKGLMQQLFPTVEKE